MLFQLIPFPGMPSDRHALGGRQAFLSAAEYFGFEFVARDTENGIVVVLDKRMSQRYEIEVLVVFPYESSRKRMSVIVRLPDELVALLGGGCPVRLYCKGADSTIIALLEQVSAALLLASSSP